MEQLLKAKRHYALLLILCLAAYLRFYHLSASSLWSDEGNTWALLSRSFSQIATDAAADIHPPGYYWLLKIWTTFFGHSAYGMRSFSALAGTLLILAVHQIVAYHNRDIITPLLAAFIIALNPFLIYYSQEARMYILLALESTTLLYILLHLIQSSSHPFIPSSCYTLCAVAGLWTHYTFPIVLGAATVVYLWTRYENTLRKPPVYSGISPGHFITLNLLALIAYLPWLPTAIESVLQWPTGGENVTLTQGMQHILETLAFGPLEPVSPSFWIIGATLLSLMGIIALWRHSTRLAIAISCWLFAPILLMFGLGLFSDAFLKFLIVAAPPWAITIAYAAHALPDQKWLRASFQMGIALGVILLSAQLLPTYYNSASARDNYVGVAEYVQIMGDPAHDLVLLNAPGQQEVWQYYDPGLPILALPTERPPDSARTVARLEQQILGRRQIFALFWATDESDPDHIVEHWLDRNAFKGLESWQGNLRFVTYALADQTQLRCVADGDRQPVIYFMEGSSEIALLEKVCQPQSAQPLVPGEVALFSLHWRAQQPTTQRYKITLQLLNSHNQVIAQRDGEPAGGSRPTDGWQPQELIVDNHGLTIPPATPPGSYRLILALYDGETGQRLQVQAGQVDFVPLNTLEISRPERLLPIAIMPIQHRVDHQLGPVNLAGYTAHAKGFDHAPQTSIQVGNQVQFTFYWQAPPSLPSEWPDDLAFTLQLGEQALTAPLVGATYPTKMWQAGDLVRGSFDILFDGIDHVPMITIQGDRLRLQALP